MLREISDVKHLRYSIFDRAFSKGQRNFSNEIYEDGRNVPRLKISQTRYSFLRAS